MYNKFHKLFDDYYQDTSTDICMVLVLGTMELADALLFEMAQEVDF